MPDGSHECRIGDAVLTVWRKYEGVNAWWQRVETPRGAWISGIGRARWTVRGAKMRARWALRVRRVP